MLLGFATTFSIVYLLPRQLGGRNWALYPALVLIMVTVLINNPMQQPSPLVAFVLIAAGLLLFWYWRR